MAKSKAAPTSPLGHPPTQMSLRVRLFSLFRLPIIVPLRGKEKTFSTVEGSLSMLAHGHTPLRLRNRNLHNCIFLPPFSFRRNYLLLLRFSDWSNWKYMDVDNKTGCNILYLHPIWKKKILVGRFFSSYVLGGHWCSWPWVGSTTPLNYLGWCLRASWFWLVGFPVPCLVSLQRLFFIGVMSSSLVLLYFILVLRLLSCRQ